MDYIELKGVGAVIYVIGLMWMAGPLVLTVLGMALFLWADYKDECK